MHQEYEIGNRKDRQNRWKSIACYLHIVASEGQDEWYGDGENVAPLNALDDGLSIEGVSDKHRQHAARERHSGNYQKCHS